MCSCCPRTRCTRPYGPCSRRAAAQHRPGRAYTLTRAPRTVRVPHSSTCVASTCRFVSSWAVVSSGCPAGSRTTTIRRAARTRARTTEGAASVPYSVPRVRRAAVQGEIAQPAEGIRVDQGPHPAPGRRVQDPVGALARRADGRGHGGHVVDAAVRGAQTQGDRQQRDDGGPRGEGRPGPDQASGTQQSVQRRADQQRRARLAPSRAARARRIPRARPPGGRLSRPPAPTGPCSPRPGEPRPHRRRARHTPSRGGPCGGRPPRARPPPEPRTRAADRRTARPCRRRPRPARCRIPPPGPADTTPTGPARTPVRTNGPPARTAGPAAGPRTPARPPVPLAAWRTAARAGRVHAARGGRPCPRQYLPSVPYRASCRP